MKNKFYLLKKPRTFIFVQIMLLFGLFTGSLQAQVPTHIWSGGTGDWNDANNWNVVTTAPQTAASTQASTTLTLSAVNAAIAVGDFVSGPAATISFGTRVTAVAGTAVTIDYPANVTNAAGAFVFYKPGATGVSFPGSAANHGALIFSGTCTVTANPAFPIKSLLVENTSSQGKLVINNGVTFAVSNSGALATPLFLVRGGLVENNGELKSTATTFNGNCVRFDTPLAAPSGDWGIIGAGILNFSNSYILASAVSASLISINHNLANTPKIKINNGSTVSISSSTISTPAVFNLAASSKLQIQGDGLSAPSTVPLFRTASGSIVTIDSGVTLTSGTSPVATTVAGTINNSGTITNTGIITNTGTIDNTGTLTNTGSLVLASTASTRGYLLSNSSVNNVTQQRYLSSNQRGWRLLSNPLASTTFNTIATASNITLGTNYTGEYVSASNTWTSTDGTATMASQQAYKVFITGLTGEAPAYATGPSNVTLKVTGTAANAVPTAITTTSGEFYLVANPYTAPVSLFGIIGASSGLSNTVSYYNPTIGSTDVKLKAGGYDFPVISAATAGDINDVVIPPMGAIFVQATSAGTINVPKSAIFTGVPAQTGTYNHKTAQGKIASSNDLKVEVTGAGTYYDTVALRFKAVGDAGSNINFGKLPNTVLDAYSISGANKMAVSELELKDQTIPLGLSTTIQKSYTFKVVENTIPAGYEAVLVDNVLNTNTVLTAGTEYNFAIDSNPASQGDARFAINLKTAGTLGVGANEMDSKIQMWPNPTSGQLNISNSQNNGVTAIEISAINGQLVHSQKSNPGTTTTIQTNNWAKGVYILKASNNGNQTTKKLIIQ